MMYLEGGDINTVDITYLKYEVLCQKLLKFYLTVRFFFYLLIIPFVAVSDPFLENIFVKVYPFPNIECSSSCWWRPFLCSLSFVWVWL